MKKYRADDFWFELTQGPSPDGVGFDRYHQVQCRKCGATNKIRSTGQAVDQLRKIFMNQNWEIGRTRHHHVCPECAHKYKHRPATEQPPKPSNVVPLRPSQPRIMLIEAWDRSSESERAEFLLALESTQGLILARPARAPVPTPDPPATTLYRVIRPGVTHLDINEIVTTAELLAAQEKYGSEGFDVKAIDSAKLEPPPVQQPKPQKSVDDFLHEVKEHKHSAKPLVDDDYQQHGPHIDSMPIEPAQPPNAHPVAVAPPDNDDKEDDDEIADWWKEIQEGK